MLGVVPALRLPTATDTMLDALMSDGGRLNLKFPGVLTFARTSRPLAPPTTSVGNPPGWKIPSATLDGVVKPVGVTLPTLIGLTAPNAPVALPGRMSTG